MNILNELDFTELFGTGTGGEIFKFMSPSRINLIGEHTDYNGGYVLPCTLDFGTYGMARKRDDDVVKFYSTMFEGVIEININDLQYKKEHGWSNYCKGVLYEYKKLGHELGGFELYITSNMPISSGLSSSASLEVLTCIVLNKLFNLDVSKIDIAIISRKAENEYMKLNCGIMDQFIIANGRKNTAMLLKCDTLQYKYFDLNLGDYKILICNTKKPRKLIESKYNERLVECQEGLKILKDKLNVENLAEITIEQFSEHKYLIEDETIRKRVEHVVYETDRTLKSTEELNNSNLEKFGEYMIQSHNSLKFLYEVTGFELDTIVKYALEEDGVLGARMVGAGFGGCAISLVHKDCVTQFKNSVGEKYEKDTGLKAEFYVANIGVGATLI